MPGTILLDDLRDSIQDQLHQHVQSLLGQAQQVGQQVVQPVQAAAGLAQAPPQIQVPSPDQVQSALLQHVDNLTQGAQGVQQNALQVLGQGQQAAGGALTELGAQRDQVQSALLDHVNTLTGGAQSGLQSLAQPTITNVAGDQQSSISPTLGGPDQTASGLGPIDASSPSAFAKSIAPYAQYAAQKLGIDPTWVAAMAGSESNYGKAQGNELFGVKALPGQAGTTMMTHEGEGGGVNMNQTFAAYDSPLDAVNAWVDLIQKHYPGAVNAPDLPTFIRGLKQGGYFTAGEGEYLNIVKGIGDRIGGDVQAGLQAAGLAGRAPTGQVSTAQARAKDLGYTDVSQFGDSQLTSAEAYAACGPAAAVRFAERFGRNPTLREATDLARDVGWTSQGGMAGIASEQKLMSNLGIDTKIIGRDWSAYAREAATGNPVTISTPGHYFYADGYNAESGAFHVGRSGLDLKGGSEWMTPAQMENLMGTAQGALFSNNPNVPAKGSVTASDEPINLGGRPQARAPLVMGGMQDASGNAVADQGPTPIQTAQDVLGGAAERVGQVASDLGTAAQGVLGAAQDINRIQPGTEAVRAITPVLGGAAQQVGQTAQDINRLQPGRAAVQAATPVLGGVASDIGAGARGVVTDLGGALSNAYGLNRTPQERQAADEQYQRDVQAAAEAMNRRGNEPITVGDVASNAWNQIIGANPPMGISLQQYQDAQNVKNQWLEQNNPARDVLVLGGLTTSIAQQLTDPLMIATFGPSMGLGRAAGAATAERVGGVLTGRLAPRAVEFASTVADKLASGAIIGGVQNALLEAEKPDATPESVFTALWQGAGFGAAADVGSAAAAPVVRRIGQTLIDRAAELRPRIAEFVGSEAGGVRLPARDVLHGQAVPRPGYEPGTPEHTTETFLQDQARQQGTPTPTISGDQIRSLPGMAGGYSNGLQEVRDAVQAGLPAARWYQQIVRQIRLDTGQDINPREAAVLMGAFGGNAGVTPNYHAMLSVFDAMRQAKPDLAGLENMTPEQVMGTQAFKDVAALVHADKAYADDDMLARVMRGYRTGEIPVPSGAKLSSYTQDFLHALNEQYSPYSTQDVWQGRLFGARPDIQGGKPLPNVSGSDAAYRSMHALTNWVAREMNLPPDQAQAAAWTVFRTLYTDPTIGPELANARISLGDAIKQGQQSGLLNPQAMAGGGLAEVTLPRGLGAWSEKLNDVKDRIKQNGSYNAPPPESATAVDRMALYHPSIQSAAQQRAVLDPSGFQYGTIAGPKVGVARPVGTEPAAALRDLALGDQPVIRVPGELQVDPSTGKVPWLALEHDVQQTAGHAYVTVAGVGDDAAHLIGQRLGADRFNHADPTAKSAGGIAVDLGSRADQARLSDALRAQGLPVLRETAGMGLRVPLMEGKAVALVRQVQQILNAEGISGTLTDYRGATHAVESGGTGARGAGRAGSQAGAAGPLGVQAGDGVRRQQLAQAVFRDAAPAAEAGAAAATGGGLRGARQRGESTLGLHLNVGGAAAPPATPVERYHYTPNGDFAQFRTGERGVVYLAESPMQALAGAQAGYRENVRRAAGIPTALREESGRLLRVNVADDLRVFQDGWPSQMTAAEHDAALDRFDTAKQGQPVEVQQALDRLRGLSTGRAGNIEGDSIRYDAPPAVLSHVEAERPAMQRALRVLGYDAVKVGDEAGTSLAVLDPSKLNVTGRAPAQATPAFGLNLGGAVAGGVAGNVATPENATPEERLRNIALGAGAGLAAGRLVPRALEGGFRAPRVADVAELARSERGEVPIVPGEQLPPERPGPVGRETAGAPPQSLSEVHTNPHLLREAAAGETPMTDEELAAHYDQLDQRYQQNQDRLASIDEQLRNPNARPERPPWAGGWTNDELAQVASSHGTSPYEPLWWEKVGLNTGSDEVKRLAEGGFRTPNAGREPTSTELRAERNTLAAEQRDIQAAADQLGNAPPGQRFTTRTQTPADLPFAGGEEEAPHGPYATEQASSGPGSLAEDIVTQNGRKSYADPLSGDGLREAPGEVVGTRGGVTGRGISDVEAARVGEPSTETVARMPNLDAMLKGDMPEVRAQIQRAAEDNPELFDAYRQGRISHDSLVTDLATKVGMTREQWLKTPVGKGFSTEEMVALQAAAIDAQARSEQMAKDIAARGGVDALSPEQVAYGLNELVNNTRLLAVARGGRTTAGRTLNALKIRLDATLARGITASNDRIAATRLASQARAAVKRASQQLEQAKQLDTEKQAVVTRARTSGAPKNIIDQIAEAYDQLDRYQAMSLHEKADDYNALKAQREAAAAKRKAAVREPPQELLSALQAELKAERDNFAKRKDTWETMAFWDSKANENAVAKRNAFRGGLYIEQYRKAADLAAKSAEADAKRAWNLESKRQSLQTQKATTLLEAVGGAKPSRELLAAYVEAVNSNDPLAAGKFVKGLMTPGWWARAQTLRIAGLLSSTITHMANMVGNVTQVPLEVATHATVVPIDWARARATGGRRVAYMAELGPMLEAYGPGFLAEMPDAVKILQTGITPADAVKLENIRPGFASGSGKVDAALEGPLRALQAEDQLFRGGAFAMQAARVATRYAYREGFRGEQLAGRRANIVKNLEDYPDLYKEAHDAMLRMVFQEHRDWIPSPRGAARGVISQPLPFIKTPANITAQGMGLSPFGVAGSIEAVRARGALEATGKATTAQLDRATLLAEQRIARTAIGTAILGLGVGLGAGTFTAGKSMLTGAYDPNEASTYPQGWREWSTVAEDPVSGNTYYIPMQNFGAAGAPLAMAAILTDAAKRGHSLLDKDEVARAATSIGQYVLDNTFLQGLSDTVNVLHDPSRYANKFLESLVSSYGPFSAMGRQIQRAYGVASRNPHDGLMGLVEAMEANYPGLSGNVPESLTAIGEPRTQGISGGAAFALPLRADILRDEPTLQALRANDVRIPPPARSVNVGNGWAIDLTPEEQDQVQRARGEQIRQQVAAVMDSTLYKNGDISVKNQLLSKAVSNASQNSDVLFVRSLADADIKQRAVRKTVPTPYTVAGEPAA
jgi:flagellum-specific peptidoglycan hydrolase FlgJ